MRNHDVEELFEMVAVGDSVELHGERTPELDEIFGITVVAQAATCGRQAGSKELRPWRTSLDAC